MMTLTSTPESQTKTHQATHLGQKVDPGHSRSSGVLKSRGRVKVEGGNGNVSLIGVILVFARGNLEHFIVRFVDKLAHVAPQVAGIGGDLGVVFQGHL